MKKFSVEKAAGEWASYAREHRLGTDYYELSDYERQALRDLMTKTAWRQSPGSKAMGRSKLYAFHIALKNAAKKSGSSRDAAHERSKLITKLAKKGGTHTYAEPYVKQTASYKRAERLEKHLAPDLWMTKGLTRQGMERVADAWDRAGFVGWADNYRAHFRQKHSEKATPSRDKARRHRTASAPSFAKQMLISKKIRLLVREGYSSKQAAAIAYKKYGAARRK